MPTQEQINATGRKYVAGLRETVRVLWVKACEHDGIDVKTSFAVFSKTNPFEPFYQKAMEQYLEAARNFAAGGYVGLQIVNGRAR